MNLTTSSSTSRGFKTPTRDEVLRRHTGHFQPHTLAPPPRSPYTPRRRSNSVGSPLFTSTQELIQRDLFKAKEPEKEKENQAKEKEKANLAGSVENCSLPHQKGKYYPCLHDLQPRKGETKEQMLARTKREILSEINKEEEARRVEHSDNKTKGIFHPCPKLNWTADDEPVSLCLSESSCNSTCECYRNAKILKSLEELEIPPVQSEDSRYNSSKTPPSAYLHDTTVGSAKPAEDKEKDQDATEAQEDSESESTDDKDSTKDSAIMQTYGVAETPDDEDREEEEEEEEEENGEDYYDEDGSIRVPHPTLFPG